MAIDTEPTVLIDGQPMTKDAAIERLQGQVAALRAQIPVADAARLAREESTLKLRDHLRAQQAAKRDVETPHGAYVDRISNAWKTQPTR